MLLAKDLARTATLQKGMGKQMKQIAYGADSGKWTAFHGDVVNGEAASAHVMLAAADAAATSSAVAPGRPYAMLQATVS